MPPEGSDLVLTANVPHREADVLVLDGFYIKAWWVKHNAESQKDHIHQNGA